MNSNNNQILSQEESLIRERLQTYLPDVADGEWFTRRLINRLPEKRRSRLPGVLQWVCYGMSAILLFATWSWCIADIARHGLSATSLILAAVIPAVVIFCMSVFAVQAVRRSV